MKTIDKRQAAAKWETSAATTYVGFHFRFALYELVK